MKAVSAHVHNGQIASGDPVDLPEETAALVLLPDRDEMTTEAPVDLDAALEESAAEFERGEIEAARAFALQRSSVA